MINELAWHSQFIRTLLVRPEAGELAGFEPEFTIIDLPSFRADPARHGTRSETVIAVNLSREADPDRRHRLCRRDEEVGVRHPQLPPAPVGVMPMHCSANIGPDGDTAVFFGLSGTGKTTLSADASRTLIGDDEHGWSDTAVFNFEGGCYAKMIRLSARGGAGDLCDYQAVRDGARERDDRSGHARARPRRQRPRREYPRRLSDRLHPQLLRRQYGAGAEERGLPHRRRLRRAAADRPPHARAGDVPFPLRLHRQGRRHRDRRHRAGSHLLDLLRRAVHAALPLGLRQPPQAADRQGRRSNAGWSTPAGPAANMAKAAGCRSRRPAPCSTPRSTAR